MKKKNLDSIFSNFKYEGPTFKPSPFEKIPAESMMEHFVNEGNAAVKKFPVLYRQLEETIQKLHPTVALGVIGFYSSVAAIGSDGTTKNLNSSIRQDHAEILQAMFLKNVKSSEPALPRPDDIQSLLDQVKELADSYSRKKSASFVHSEDSKLISEAYITEHLQLHTQIVRNWAHFYQAMETAQKVFTKIDENFEREIGISAIQLVNIFVDFVEQIDERANEHFKYMAKLMVCESVDELLDLYNKTCGDNGLSESFIRKIKQENLTLERVQILVFSQQDFQLYKNYLIDSDELAKKWRVDGVKLAHLFAQLSIGYGEAHSEEFEDIFIANPIWRKPFIKLEEALFFLPLPNLLPGYIFRILEALMSKSPRLLDRYLKKTRAEYLENEIKRCFENSFPGAEVSAGYQWQNFESDLLVKIDTNLFIVEAKSHKANPASLRGGIKSARTHVEKVFLGPSIQSLRLQNQIERAKQSSADVDCPIPRSLTGFKGGKSHVSGPALGGSKSHLI